MARTPSFPPLFSGHCVPENTKLVAHAQSMAKKAKIGAGDLLWSDDTRNLKFALVLEPEVSLTRCAEMLYAAMVAFGDAAGALIPPEVSVTYRWPNQLLMNEAVVGECDLLAPAVLDDEVPDWIILCVNAAIMPESADLNPGQYPDRTTLWDEGCGEITRTQLLESVSRHLLNWIHIWSEEGFKPVHQKWMRRLSKNNPLSPLMQAEVGTTFVGLDESGKALLKRDGEIAMDDVFEALNQSRTASDC